MNILLTILDCLKILFQAFRYGIVNIPIDNSDSAAIRAIGLLNPFFVINPDTVWSKHYQAELKSLEAIYLKNNKPTLLLVNKKLSIDPSFKGDFNLNNEKISKDSENQFIFTGLQIINRSVFTNEQSEVFSLNKVWNKLIKDKNLLGLESNQKFYHLNTSDMYRKIQSFNIID